MESVSYTEVRKSLKELFDHACNEHVPVFVHRKKGGEVVILSKDDYLALEETAYLSRSPVNLKRILEAMNRSESKSLDEIKNDLGI